MRQAAFILYSNISNTLSMTFYFGRSVPRDIGRTKLPITEKLTPCTICCLPVFQWDIVLIVLYKNFQQEVSVEVFAKSSSWLLPKKEKVAPQVVYNFKLNEYWQHNL